MPLITAAVLAYAAGLLTGFGGAFLWTATAALLVIWHGGHSARDRVALAALAAAGLALATRAGDVRERCRERLLRTTAWELTLEDDADAGDLARARHRCGVMARVAVSEGAARAGARVAVAGAVTRSRNGILVTDAVLRQVRPPGRLARWRAVIGRDIDIHFGSHAPLVRALLIADAQDLTPALRDRFAASGLSHMLSVSGLHVGLIAAGILLLAQMARLPRGRADLVVVLATTGYVAVIGAPLPAVRAAAMLAAWSLSRAAQRPTSPWAVLAVGVGLPLVSPVAVLDLGYQLSAAGMVALVSAGALAKRWPAVAGARGWRGALARALLTSMAATLITAPLVAATFGRVSLVAPLSNLVAVPVVAVLQPMLFLALLLLPLAPAARFVADAAAPLLLAFDTIATHAAALPGAAVPVLTDSTTMALAGAAATALVVASVSRWPATPLLLAAASVALIAWRPLLPRPSTEVELHVLDVGQGDAIAVRTGRGRWLLFDAGREWRGGDEGRRQIVPYLARRGGALVAFVLSHPHADHVGGAASTVRALRPHWYFDPGYVGASGPYRASLLAAREAGVRWRRVRPRDSLVVDDVTVTFLAPDSAWADSLRDPNEASTVARVRVGSVAILLTGDAEAGEERWLVRHQAALLRADVLKVAHHGSTTSSTPEFLRAVRPRLAVVSVGPANRYGHPARGVMRSLAAHGAVALRTDRHGGVVLRTDGTRIEVEAAGERWFVR